MLSFFGQISKEYLKNQTLIYLKRCNEIFIYVLNDYNNIKHFLLGFQIEFSKELEDK